MLGFFTQETVDVFDIEGNLKASEPVHLTRQGISNNDFAHTHKYKGLLIPKTVISEGDLLVNDKGKYLVTAFRGIQFLNTNQINLWRCDYECSIYSLQDKYVGNQKAGVEQVAIKENIPCIQKDVNGKMKYFDGGLLESTTKIVYIQYDAAIELTHRLVINGKNYQIDSIDTSMKNIMCLQLSDDKRAINEEY